MNAFCVGFLVGFILAWACILGNYIFKRCSRTDIADADSFGRAQQRAESNNSRLTEIERGEADSLKRASELNEESGKLIQELKDIFHNNVHPDDSSN